jgi:hypothetical protein
MATTSLKAIRAELDAALTLLETEDTGGAREKLTALRDGLGARARADLPDSVPVRLETFFDEVGQGMLAAQRQLDQASADYNRWASARGGAQPSAFRIPKASAEFQFGTQTTEEGGFNLLILSDKHSTQNTITHKVSFDVVSVPPPPETLLALSQGRSALASLLAAVLDDADASESERDIARLLMEHLAEAVWLRGDSASLLAWTRYVDGKPAEVCLALFAAARVPLVARLVASRMTSNLARLFQTLVPAGGLE